METLSATQARSNFFDLIQKVAKGHRQVRVVSKRGDVVVMSEEDYDSLLETLELLSTPGVLKGVRKAKQDIKKGRTYSLEDVFGG